MTKQPSRKERRESARKKGTVDQRSKMAGTSVTKTGDWCKTVLAPLSGLVWSPDALVLPSLEAVWSLVNEAETSIEVTPMIPPTQRSIDSALAAHTEATSGVVRRTRMRSSLAEQATESLRLLNELMRLVDSGSLKASATERAHMVGAMTGLNALVGSKLP